MNIFQHLSPEEKNLLLKLPAYISMLAATDHRLDEEERKEALRLAYVKTFSHHPMLDEYYNQAYLVFEPTIDQLQKELPEDREERRALLENDLIGIKYTLSKLDILYSDTLFKSLDSFRDHVSRAHHNIFMDFLFPVPIPGLTK